MENNGVITVNKVNSDVYNLHVIQYLYYTKYLLPVHHYDSYALIHTFCFLIVYVINDSHSSMSISEVLLLKIKYIFNCYFTDSVCSLSITVSYYIIILWGRIHRSGILYYYTFLLTRLIYYMHNIIPLFTYSKRRYILAHNIIEC